MQKLQAPNARDRLFGCWMLVFLWSLDVGAWSFCMFQSGDSTSSQPGESLLVSVDKTIFTDLLAVRSSSLATTLPSFLATAASVPGAKGIFHTRGEASAWIFCVPRYLPFRNSSTSWQLE